MMEKKTRNSRLCSAMRNGVVGERVCYRPELFDGCFEGPCIAQRSFVSGLVQGEKGLVIIRAEECWGVDQSYTKIEISLIGSSSKE